MQLSLFVQRMAGMVEKGMQLTHGVQSIRRQASEEMQAQNTRYDRKAVFECLQRPLAPKAKTLGPLLPKIRMFFKTEHLHVSLYITHCWVWAGTGETTLYKTPRSGDTRAKGIFWGRSLSLSSKCKVPNCDFINMIAPNAAANLSHIRVSL